MKPINFTRKYLFEDERVSLIPLSERHIEPLSRVSSDPRIWEHLTESGTSLTDLTIYVRQALADHAACKAYPFVVFDKLQERFVGTTRIYEINPGLGHMKMGHTWYGVNSWGTGINLRTKYLLFQWIFEDLHAARVGFGVHARNHRSLASLRRLQCQQEGILRSFFPRRNSQQRDDLIILSLLQSEWENSARNWFRAQLTSTAG
ncbi:MAG: GNAT family protein [Bacteroidota bacterium]